MQCDCVIATHHVLKSKLLISFYSSGRAGEKGTAYTLVTEKDKEFAGHLVRNLEGVNQDVPQNILDLAMQSAWFRKSRFKSGRGKKMNISGRGLGYRERPGLGSSDSQANSGSGVVPNSIADLIPKPVRTGPGTDRLSAMKAAFRSQYMSQVRMLCAGTSV
jgi:ATP-dependent RNA helicase DDX42